MLQIACKHVSHLQKQSNYKTIFIRPKYQHLVNFTLCKESYILKIDIIKKKIDLDTYSRSI